MVNFLILNWLWLSLTVVGALVIIYAISKFQTPEETVPATESANFATDLVVSTPVMQNNPHVDIFRDAANAAINENINPWTYLDENWERSKELGNVEATLIDFITNEAHQQIPNSSNVTLSVRDYSNPNSIVMEYRDPQTDSIMVTTGHDPEPALYATFANKKDSITYKLICANGLVRELSGKTTDFNQDYVIKKGDSFIGITGSTPAEANKFAEDNDLEVRFIVTGKVASKTPNTSKVKVFADYRRFKKGIFDVVLQPEDILRKQDGKWFYVKTIN